MKRQYRNSRKTGSFYEQLAGRFLEQKGYRILEYNYRCPFSEIDIIALQEDTLVFCEVKYRGGSSCGFALEAVDRKKQLRISRGALYYIRQKKPPQRLYRFDVIGIENGKVRIIRDAFPFCG